MDFNFEELTDKVKDTIKKVPPWGWVALAGGGAVLVYLGTRTPAYTEPGIVRATTSSGGSAVGLGGGGDSNSMSAGSDGVLSQLTESIKELASENNELDKAFNRVSNEFVSYQTNTNKVLEQTQTTFDTLSSKLAYETTRADIPDIYFDGKDDLSQYRTITEAIKTATSFNDDEKNALIKKTAGLGNNGVVDPNYKGKPVTLTDIKSDPKVLQDSIELTNNVIANRKEAGLSTSVQESWLKQLTTK